MKNVVLATARELAEETNDYTGYHALLKGRAQKNIQPKVLACVSLHEITQQKRLDRILRKTKNPTTRKRIQKEINEFIKDRCSIIEDLLELSFTNKEKDEEYFSLFK